MFFWPSLQLHGLIRRKGYRAIKLKHTIEIYSKTGTLAADLPPPVEVMIIPGIAHEELKTVLFAL